MTLGNSPEWGGNFMRTDFWGTILVILVIYRAHLQGRTSAQTQRGTLQDNTNTSQACPQTDVWCGRGKKVKTRVSFKVWIPDYGWQPNNFWSEWNWVFPWNLWTAVPQVWLFRYLFQIVRTMFTLCSL